MQGSNAKIWILLLAISFGCKKKVEQEVFYDNIIYQLNTTNLYNSGLEKNKQKTNSQYLSIVYSDLYQKSIPTVELNDLSQIALAIGDKQAANELVVSNYMKDPLVVLPAKSEMISNVDQFIDETYIRFYLRKPSELERYYFKDLIETDTSITPEMIYYAFSVSEEYQFY